jgi:glyoxylase-like metal-dependent hydrolase (beta-lactamase superfamily II)
VPAVTDKPYEVVPGVYEMGSEFVNWYLVEEGRSYTAVDAGLPGFASGLETQLAAVGVSPGDVAAVVLTHSDADHTGLVPQLRAAGARVLIHADDASTLARPRPKQGDASPRHLLAHALDRRLWRVLRELIKNGAAKPPRISGAQTFSDGETLDVPGRPRAVHMPGHTPGHCALLFEGRGALFVGDGLCTINVLTQRRGPQVMPSLMNWSTDECFRSLAAIEGLPAEVVLFGHGEPARDSPQTVVAQARAAERT